MKNELQIGDLVKLKSGSPTLTVFEVEHNMLNCYYWDYDAKDDKRIKHTGLFDFELFTKI